MTCALTAISNRIRKLELQLKIAGTELEAIEEDKRKAFNYFLDKEEGKAPELPPDLTMPRYLFKIRTKYYEKFLEYDPDLKEEFDKLDNYMQHKSGMDDFMIKHHKIRIRMQKYKLFKLYEADWFKVRKKIA